MLYTQRQQGHEAMLHTRDITIAANLPRNKRQSIKRESGVQVVHATEFGVARFATAMLVGNTLHSSALGVWQLSPGAAAQDCDT